MKIMAPGTAALPRPARPPSLRRARGMTLVELMVVILVAAILLGLAVPAMRNLLYSNQILASTDNFAGALNLARSEAIKQGVPIALVSSSGTNDWSGGWTMFVDSDGNGTQSTVLAPPAPPELTVRVGAAQPGGYTLMANSTLGGLLQFDSNGRLLNAGSARFVVCQGGGPWGGGLARMVTIKATGRVRISANDASGHPLYDDSATALTGCTP
jgi:type IV fimbrial biogenesis protein FimT